MNKIDILIVDDNLKKAEKIVNIIRKCKYSFEHDMAVNIVQAKRALKDKSYDLVILDIQLPNRTGDKIKKDGGVELLKSLGKGSLHHPTHIIGLSAYTESIEESLSSFTEKSLVLIQFDETVDEWEKQLLEKINQIGRSKSSKYRIEEMNYDYDIAILCALEDPELKSILRLDCQWEQLEVANDNVSDYYRGTIERDGEEIKIVATSSPQMGMPATSIMATKLIANFKPKYLVMTGIAAGVKGKVDLGDVIVADNCWDYESGKKVSNDDGKRELLPDYKPLRLSSALGASVRRLSRKHDVLSNIRNDWQGQVPNTSLKIHLGDLASGSSVVTDSEVVGEIQRHARKLLGIEMEAYGVHLAADLSTEPSPQAIVIKSVCDFADSSKNDDYQSYAAYTSARVLYYLAMNEWKY
ncbi:phosphorylase family protein [Marinilactibacillus psychrotolerans]|uniref:phosphorylase family protein n=1 Tax=Marinilactibacillus psychrotolerans TaxID=191770 RepID=UPI00388A55D3